LGLLSPGSRVLAALLLFCALCLPACGGTPDAGAEIAQRPTAQNDGADGAEEPGRVDAEVERERDDPDQDDPDQDGGNAFVHQAGPGNIWSNSTYIDHPASNGNPDAVVFATRVGRPETPVGDHEIGVWYSAERERWAVFHQDRSPMPEGAAFNISVAEAPSPASAGGEDGAILAHRAGARTIAANSTYVDHPLANGNPDAVLAVTSNWNPGGEGGTYNDRAVGVWYDANRERWAVFNQDRSPMPEGAAFNLAVAEEPAEAGLSVHRATPENTTRDGTYLDLPFANGDPNAVLSVTASWNPGGGGGIYHDHPVGVRYDAKSGRWLVFDADGSPMPEGVAFNVGEHSAIVAAAGTSEQAGGPAATRAPIEGEGKPEGPPEYRDFFAEEGDPKTPQSFVSAGTSAGAIPAVKPFNFGRDPGGPEDKTLYLTVPEIGLQRVPVYDSTSEKDLRRSAVHVPATGFPWQEGANTFIAGHRVGYPNTGSYYVFFDLVELGEGDEILIEDSAGGRYEYRVTGREVVGPNDVDSMNPVEGKSVVSLQTCTLPDYAERIVVRGELVEKST
jgi:sortase A